MKTENEIIKETVEYYWADPGRRATSSRGCEYLTADGRMCAVGRCMTEETRLRTPGAIVNVVDLSDYFSSSLDDMLQPEYRGHPVHFWALLQNLHDGACWVSKNHLLDRLSSLFPDFPLDTLSI